MGSVYLYGLGAIIGAVIVGVVYAVHGAILYSRSAVITVTDLAERRRLERIARFGDIAR